MELKGGRRDVLLSLTVRCFQRENDKSMQAMLSQITEILPPSLRITNEGAAPAPRSRCARARPGGEL